jgi:hypothetical protein
MTDHLSDDDRSRFLRGALPRERVLAVVRHLEECRACAGAAAASEQVARATDALATDLAAVVPMRRGRLRWTLAAAAAAAIIVAVLLLVRLPRQRVQPAPPLPVVAQRKSIEPRKPYARAAWISAVDDAMRRGAIAMPSTLADLQLAPDPARAPAVLREQWLEPAAAIVETTRPSFRWAAARDASYEVSVLDGETLVAKSAALREAAWQPDRELKRGRTYLWQVRVRTRDGDESLLPAPPAPPALFRVLDESTHEELDAARAAHPSDHLLLGVLYARNGLRAEAEHELALASTPEARRILQSVQRWPR